MEDAHAVCLNLGGDRSSAFFGVYDGHGSSLFAEYCSQHLHQEMLKSSHYGEFESTCLWERLARLVHSPNCCCMVVWEMWNNFMYTSCTQIL